MSGLNLVKIGRWEVAEKSSGLVDKKRLRRTRPLPENKYRPSLLFRSLI